MTFRQHLRVNPAKGVRRVQTRVFRRRRLLRPMIFIDWTSLIFDYRRLVWVALIEDVDKPWFGGVPMRWGISAGKYRRV